ncbi:MAG: ribose-phosphate diphosphokinase [Thermodesulfobacteriota bacterium]
MRTDHKNDLFLVSNQASIEFAHKVAAELGIPHRPMIRKQFSDGEIYHAFPENIAGRDLIVIGATPDDASHQELIDLIDGGHLRRAHSVSVVVPFLGYSTMEQAKPDSNEIAKGITRTRQIFRARPSFVAFIDLHSEAVLHAHGGDIHTVNLRTDALLAEKLRRLDLGDFVLVSPDYGRSKWVARMAGLLGVPHTATDKDRFAMDQTMVGQVAGVVRGKTAVICDDMIRTGGSIIQTAERCREAGASGVVLVATHLVMAGDARRKCAEHGIDRIIGADTYPGVRSDELLEVYSVAPLVARGLARQLRLGLPAGEARR